MTARHAYTCGRCWTIYDPASQGHCPVCGRHPHLEDDCDHDCDWCSSVAFPPVNGHLDLFAIVGTSHWKRVPRTQ